MKSTAVLRLYLTYLLFGANDVSFVVYTLIDESQSERQNFQSYCEKYN